MTATVGLVHSLRTRSRIPYL